jgi:hypothetical protein
VVACATFLSQEYNRAGIYLGPLKRWNMSMSLQDRVIAELKSGGQLSQSLRAEISKALEPSKKKRREQREALVRSRLAQANKFNKPVGAAGHPPPPRTRLPRVIPNSSWLPFFVTVASQSSDFLLGIPEQPVVGDDLPELVTFSDGDVGAPPNTVFHQYSELARKATGEVSLSAIITDSSEISPTPEGILQLSGSIVQMWVLPKLPTMGLSVLGAMANVSASSLLPSVLVSSYGDGAAAVYGFATIQLCTTFDPATNLTSSSVEFLRQESFNPSSNYSDFDEEGFLTLTTNVKLEPPSVFVFAEVEISLLLAAKDAKFSVALADFRFADDNSLASIPDFSFSTPYADGTGYYQPTILPPTSPIRVTLIQIEGR